jgi:acetylornithine/succinyldiaminopimelate/putrescine aminotransferase
MIGSLYTTPTIKYLDFVAGVSACTLGHQPQRVNQAIKDQLQYSLMVYGEYSQSPAVEYCKLILLIARTIKKTHLVNSGTEAEVH